MLIREYVKEGGLRHTNLLSSPMAIKQSGPRQTVFQAIAIKLPLGANNICLVYKYNVSYTVYIFHMM